MIGHVLNDMNEVITNDYSDNHQAIDLISQGNPESDIIALESGIVEEVVTNIPSTDHNSKGNATYGNYVKIKQNNGKSALYAHMKYGSISVNTGDYIEKGAIIGTMGSTGNAYGNHLHLEIKNQDGIKENPIVSLTTPQENTETASQPEPQENIKQEEPQKRIEITELKSKEQKTTTKTKKSKQKIATEDYLVNQTYNDGSIVDGLKEINIDSSYDYREKLAIKNGINDYHGSYEQNVYLLQLLRDGKLIKA
ncbi:MAG: peptidoglycan DD-metalloendopeptidase family protein [Bacilli bacterium]|nr:peptidoglycan DD-metalloendopeptidase family protein [Bacilli bacterium]